jgi:hypothetical protein
MNPGAFGPQRRAQLDAVAAANTSAMRGRESEMRAHMAGQPPQVKPGAAVGFAGSVPSGTPTGA